MTDANGMAEASQPTTDAEAAFLAVLSSPLSTAAQLLIRAGVDVELALRRLHQANHQFRIAQVKLTDKRAQAEGKTLCVCCWRAFSSDARCYVYLDRTHRPLHPDVHVSLATYPTEDPTDLRMIWKLCPLCFTQLIHHAAGEHVIRLRAVDGTPEPLPLVYKVSPAFFQAEGDNGRWGIEIGGGELAFAPSDTEVHQLPLAIKILSEGILYDIPPLLGLVPTDAAGQPLLAIAFQLQCFGRDLSLDLMLSLAAATDLLCAHRAQQAVPADELDDDAPQAPPYDGSRDPNKY